MNDLPHWWSRCSAVVEVLGHWAARWLNWVITTVHCDTTSFGLLVDCIPQLPPGKTPPSTIHPTPALGILKYTEGQTPAQPVPHPALRRSGGVGGGGGEDGPELQVWTGCKHWRNVRPVRNCHHVTGGNVDLESLSVSPSWTKYDKYCIDDSDRSTAVLPLFRLTSLRRTEVLSLDSWLHQVARGHGGYSVRLL